MGRESGSVVMNVILESGYLDLDSHDATFQMYGLVQLNLSFFISKVEIIIKSPLGILEDKDEVVNRLPEHGDHATYISC